MINSIPIITSRMCIALTPPPIKQVCLPTFSLYTSDVYTRMMAVAT